jgi:hypothetical protein
MSTPKKILKRLERVIRDAHKAGLVVFCRFSGPTLVIVTQEEYDAAVDDLSNLEGEELRIDDLCGTPVQSSRSAEIS